MYIQNMTTKHEFLKVALTSEDYQTVKGFISENSKKKNIEVEASVSISLEAFVRVSKEYANLLDDSMIDDSAVLDVIIKDNKGDNYRFSVIDDDVIDRIVEEMKRQRVEDVRSYLEDMIAAGKNIILDKKMTSPIIKSIGYGFRIKTSSEELLKPEHLPSLTGSEKITYRYKNRFTFRFEKHQIDLTSVRQSTTLWDLMTKPSKYEAEVEIVDRKINMKEFGTAIQDMLMKIEDTQVLIDKEEKDRVIQKYREITHIQSKAPSYRIQVSMDISHVKLIPNKYVVVSKADGQRHLMIILEDGVYLIDTNMNVRKTLHTCNSYHGAILDGELIKIQDKQVYMAFDIITDGKKLYSQNKAFNTVKRVAQVEKIISECFTLIPFEDYATNHQDMDLSKIIKFYGKELERYWKQYRKALDKEENDMMVTRNLYLIPYGIDSAEVFAYADLLWKKSTRTKQAPYILDGIIYTPIDITYDGAKEIDSSMTEFKWKSPSHNSIDFYVEYLKDKDGIEKVFHDETGSSPYKTLRLCVGKTDRLQEFPISFKIDGRPATANIYLVDDECRTLEGDIIHDASVVEFTYDALLIGVEDAFRWSPMRIRFDKTESVQRYKRRYGNYAPVASRIWNTIVNPVSEDDIAALANPDTFAAELASISLRIGAFASYYQKDTQSSRGMRAFNNWIKSNLISMYVDNETQVLDIGCGRGGDLPKYVSAGVSKCVGVDLDSKGLFAIHDCAVNRYMKMKKANPNIPPMTFIQADGRALFTVEDQLKALPTLIPKHTNLIDRYLTGNVKYQSISIQFNIHYYMGDETSWNNFCQNINTVLDENGFVIITAFDGEVVEKKLAGRKSFGVTYVDDTGKKVPYFDIRKVYSDDHSESLGKGIDFYNSLISQQGVYNREYLVMPEFLINQMREKCQLELVETDNFYNIYKTYQGFFEKSQNSAHDKIKQFYQSTKDSKPGSLEYAAFIFCIMNRYYVFRKIDTTSMEPKRIPPLSNQIQLGGLITPYLANANMVIDVDNSNRSVKKVYQFIRKDLDATPNVYVLHHHEEDLQIGGSSFCNQTLTLTKAREGNGLFCLIYKSPEKIYHPIYRRVEKPVPEFKQIMGESQRCYTLASAKVLADLEYVVQLNSSFNIKK
jgi:hypothetical protein